MYGLPFLSYVQCVCSPSEPSLVKAVPQLLHPLPQLLLTVALIPCENLHTHEWIGIHMNEKEWIDSLDDVMSHNIVREWSKLLNSQIPNY